MLPALLLAVLAPAPLLALVVLTTRLREARLREARLREARRQADTGAHPARAAWRAGTTRPIWPALAAIALTAATLTAGLEHTYLAALTHGPAWGFDVVLTTLMLALLAAIACAVLAGLTAAAVGRARGFGAGTIAGLLTLTAVAAGTAAAHLPLRAAHLTEPGTFPTPAHLGDGDLLLPFDAFLAALLWALPWPILGAALATRATSRRHPTGDLWHLLLDLATTDLPPNRTPWGAALRAELATIDPPAQRRRFALGGIWTILRTAAPHRAWIPATAVALLTASGSFAASRWSLAHDRGGILDFWMTAPALLLLAVALTTARRSRSFATGLRATAPATLAALIAVLAVGIPEALHWADRRAGYLTTGDALPPTWQAAVLDVVRPEFLIGMIAFWTAATIGGAALGTALARPHTPGTTARTTP
ncbi:hypothetical protein ACFWY5_43080 [Nonomuraea sp. NPDC059007]|uniref:hypothetical protein n=1 Tax=Nonomuraea sp. NPDC059007 TaxID=3346692 RepID=UPI003673D4CD